MSHIGAAEPVIRNLDSLFGYLDSVRSALLVTAHPQRGRKAVDAMQREILF